jgi:hypothetical protein
MLWMTGLRLAALSVAALLGGLTYPVEALRMDVAGAGVAVCFAVAMAIEISGMRRRPERTWYEGRAAAESLKTLAWRYAIGGDPFPLSLSAADAEKLMVKRIDEVLDGLHHLTLHLPPGHGDQITAQMRAVRTSSLDERRSVYLRDRIQDQKDWYSVKSEVHRRAGTRWSIALLAIELCGFLGALVKATTPATAIDVLGFAGALAAGTTAWLQMKQHENLGTAYTVTASELSSVKTSSQDVTDETSWSRFVDESEEAISREHTMWKASRAVSSPLRRPDEALNRLKNTIDGNSGRK